MKTLSIAVGLAFLLPLQDPKVDFARDVRPILKASCHKCHGAEGNPKGQLRLDLKSFAFRGGVSGSVIVPGDSARSRLVQLLLSADKDERMPQKAPPLAQREIDLIRRWIDEGAAWPDDGAGGPSHWALRPLTKPRVPDARGENPIDAFVRAKLEERGLAPSPPADRRTLLRRVTFNLTGLPPTPEESDAFLADPSADAFARVVDRLLASPRYGERWARHWLDVVHYADTHGHDQDRPRPNAWPYRDYVIRSLNEDKPYARFVEEQLAGDILYPDDPQGIVATGFIATGPWDESSQMHIMADTVDKKIAQNLDRDDMVTTSMSTFLSTTVHCARCHNHKFDPIPQADYYALQAVFAGVDRANRPYDNDPQTNRLRQSLLKQKSALAARQKAVMASLLEPALQAEVAVWELRAGAAAKEIWIVLEPAEFTSADGSTLTKQPDGSVVSNGARPEADAYTITAHTDLKGITAVRLEVLTDESLSNKGPGRQDNGNLHLSEFRVNAAPKGKPEAARAVKLQNPTADFSQQGWTIAHAIDGKMETAWGVYPEIGKPHVAVFEFKDPVAFEGGATFTFVLEQRHGRHHLIARPRLSVTVAPRPVGVNPHPVAVMNILATPAEKRTDAQRADLAAHYLSNRIDRKLAELPPPQMVYAAASDFPPLAKFTPARVPRPIHVLRRGDILHPGVASAPGSLSCVPIEFKPSDADDEGSRRAALAKWITDPRNALTWRSIVNRVWHYHFGRGIVETPNDFGKMGGTPSHPELLDWLAFWFFENGGSLKKLHRLIVMSAVYRQSFAHDPRGVEADAGNRLLWRMNRARLDAESVRDAILQVSGKLDLTMGGPSVKQFRYEDPNPDVTPKVDYARFDVDDPASFRRSVYRYIFRTLPDPFMDCMDCADASQLTPVRGQSVSALQAMAMLNNKFVVSQSGHFAARVAKAGDVEAQVGAAYRLALGRAPRPGEAKALSAYAAKHGTANACRLLLNSNEFMFVD